MALGPNYTGAKLHWRQTTLGPNYTELGPNYTRIGPNYTRIGPNYTQARLYWGQTTLGTLAHGTLIVELYSKWEYWHLEKRDTFRLNNWKTCTPTIIWKTGTLILTNWYFVTLALWHCKTGTLALWHCKTGTLSHWHFDTAKLALWHTAFDPGLWQQLKWQLGQIVFWVAF